MQAHRDTNIQPQRHTDTYIYTYSEIHTDVYSETQTDTETHRTDSGHCLWSGFALTI